MDVPVVSGCLTGTCTPIPANYLAKLEPPLTAWCNGSKLLLDIINYTSPYNYKQPNVVDSGNYSPWDSSKIEFGTPMCRSFFTVTLEADMRYQGIYEGVSDGPRAGTTTPLVYIGGQSAPTIKGSMYYLNIEHGPVYQSVLVESFSTGNDFVRPNMINPCPAAQPLVLLPSNADSNLLIINKEPYTLIDFTHTKQIDSFYMGDSRTPIKVVPMWSGAINHTTYHYQALFPITYPYNQPFVVNTSLHFLTYNSPMSQPMSNSTTIFTDNIHMATLNAPLYARLGKVCTMLVYSITFINGFHDQVEEIWIKLPAGRIASFKESFAGKGSYTSPFLLEDDCLLTSCVLTSYVITYTGEVYFSSFSITKGDTMMMDTGIIQRSIGSTVQTKMGGKVIIPSLLVNKWSLGDNLPSESLAIPVPNGLLPVNSLISKCLEYPAFFSGYLQFGTFTPAFSFPSDTPTCNYAFAGGNSRVYDIPSHNISNLDLTSPLVHVTMLTPSVGTDRYRLLITVKDEVGIGENTCNVTVGERDNALTVYALNSGSRASGDHSVGTYLVDIDYSEAHFCHSPITIMCTDIRGYTTYAKSNEYCVDRPCNDLTKIFSNLPSCESTVTPIYRSRLTYFGYVFIVETTIQVNAMLSGAFKFNNATVCMFDDMDNNMPSKNMSCVQLHQTGLMIKTGLVILSANITFPALSVTKNYYFRLQYSIDSTQPTLTLSSSDIAYFSQVTATDAQSYSNNQVTIRNIGYKPLPVDIIVNIIENDATSDLTVQLTKTVINPSDNIKNITIVVFDNFLPQPKYNNTWYYNSTQLPFNLTRIVTSGSQLLAYVSSMCDNNENCEYYPMFGYFANINISMSGTTVINDNVLTNPSIKFGNMAIDVSKPHRYSNYSISFTSATTIQCGAYYPILFLTELGSLDDLQFPASSCFSNGNALTFNGSLTVPYSWGLRGVVASVWNVVDRYGYTTGVIFDSPVPTFTIDTVTRVDHAVLDYYYKTINITGAGFVGADFTLNDQLIPFTPSYPDLNTAIIPFNDAIFKPYLDKYNYVKINGVPFLLDFFYCVSFDCSGHGTCIEDTCRCDPAWVGVDCSISRNYTCPNNCSGNGDCVDQNCMCHNGYAGPTCNLHIDEVKADMNFKEEPSTATTILGVSNEANDTKLTPDSMSVSYNISIVAIQEMSYNDSVANNIILNWKLASTTSNSTKYTISNMGGIQDPSNTITLTIDKFMDGGQTTWANNVLNFQPNTIKYTVRFDGYNFTSQLNYIQIIFETVSTGDCVQRQNENITWGAASLQDMHYFVIPQHQMQCYGRFPTSVISDGRILSISNKIISAAEPVQIATAVPYFKKSAAIDPDFSVLISYNQANGNAGQCDIIGPKDGMKPYVIPLIVVGCVIFVAIVGLAVFIKLKKSFFVRHTLHKMRSKNNFSSNKLDNL
ncbi:hypothetical protein SAMD00019534_089120 [Acytostelium subglobosum LB1]|uniref:hypothetical protein n=1 Tax=Acytostelium subglobosum LB1 TaxID=1410327 RepID=UPI000644BB65|nr:hypothetical protein SAMD00019534_089120 [Acytostelium subglobosum LB1]GAM25737.1 hypothetical protein SAMD00019534_089120 [Acytostelium subglobosum LB1]|eukprot:XP_012751255.1 hypothetical protein SAMD00019534_089120 [Acytostelium subglobosum LB1]